MSRGTGIVCSSLTLGALLLSAGTASATVLWRGDFSTGDTSQWTGAEEVSPSRLEVLRDPLGDGSWVLQATVEQGDNPINASGNRNELFYEGDNVNVGNGSAERFYHWRTMWPADYVSPATWQLFTQWHQYQGGGSPPVEFYLNGENVNLTVLSRGDHPEWTVPLQRGVWHDFIIDVNWSEDPSVGYYRVWYDGQEVVAKTPAATLMAGGGGVYLKQGLYRNADITEAQRVYHTGMTIATTLADVLSTAASTAPDAGVTGQSGSAPSSPDASTGTTVTAEAPSSGSPDASTTSNLAMQVSDTLSHGGTTGSAADPQVGCAQAGTTGAALLVLMSVGGLLLRKSRRRLPSAR
jgi:hypothetical protein